MPKYKNYQHSSQLVSEKKLYDEFGNVDLNLEGDKRLDALHKEVDDWIRQSTVTKSEKQICEHIVRLIHEDRYYGAYDKKTQESLIKQKKLQFEIESLAEDEDLSPKQKDVKRKELKKDLNKLLNENNADYLKRGGTNLKDYKAGSLVCREESAIASYVMHKVGIANSVISDFQGDVFSPHVFIQTDNTKAILETTNPKKPYKVNLNGAQADKAVVITEDEAHYGNGRHVYNHVIEVYAGKYSTEKANSSIKSGYKEADSKYLNDLAGEYKANLRSHKSLDGMTVAELSKHLDGMEVSMDKGGKFLGLGKDKDGLLNGDEIAAGLKSRGCKIEQSEIDELKKSDLRSYAPKNISYKDIEEMDKNHNGKISIKEITATFSKHEMKIAQQYGLDVALFCSVNNFSHVVDVKSR